jgi:REP element-mobilizing transposase RayT
MLSEQLSRHEDLRIAGWSSRGYLPHFDGREVPQFVTCRLFDSIPASVLKRWMRELDVTASKTDRIRLHQRVEKYLDQGYGSALLKHHRIAQSIEVDLLSFDGESLHLSAWVIMPNHIHLLFTRFESLTLAGIMQSFKSLTAHKSNRLLERRGPFWMVDYFDRYIRNAQHFVNTVRYIEQNPVKAGLCEKAEDWPFSSARFRLRE